MTPTDDDRDGPDDQPRPWSVIARNLPEHAGNPIHTDAGALAAGFPSALVAGVTTYAYLTHPVVAAWGRDWIEHGGGDVRFRAPVPADERVDCLPRSAPDGVCVVDAICPALGEGARATFGAVRDSGPPPIPRGGDVLPSRRVTLDGPFGSDYGWRAGDDLRVYLEQGITHPAAWPAIANRVYTEELVDGPWIHTRSTIRHHAVGRAGRTVDVHATVVDRFELRGERVVCDIVIEDAGTVLATIEHEAIVRLEPTERG